MKAIFIDRPQHFEFREIPKPALKAPNQVLVKMDIASICGTDVRMLGEPSDKFCKKPMILGHEAVGTIEAVGAEIIHVKPGDRVVMNPVVACGVCPSCLRGMPNLCSNVIVRGCTGDGYFAEYVTAGPGEVIRINREVPLELAVFAEPLSCVLGGIKKLKVMPGDTALVFGGGPIGLYFAQFLKANGARQVIVSEVSEFRKNFARSLGVDHVIDPTESCLAEEVMKLTANSGADICVDAVGCLIADAIECAGKNGTILLFGQNHEKTQTIVECGIVDKALKIFGNIQGDHTFGRAVEVLESGMIDFTKMVTHRMPFTDFGAGLEAMRKGEALEVVLYF